MFDIVSYLLGTLNGEGGGGGGGGVTLLSGTSAPAAAQGSNGGIYLQYGTIPADYTLLEYIQSTGTQYIDTQYIPTVYTKVEMKLNPQVLQESAIFGSEWALNGFFMMFYEAMFRWHSATAVNSATISANTDYTVKADVSGFEVNGTRYATTAAAPVATAIRLFSTTTPGTGTASNTKGSYKLYYFSVYENETPTMRMLPVKRNSDNALGMYDIIGGQFYGNGGTGAFTAGPEQANSPTPIVATYAKVSGEWQVLIGTDIDDIDLGN